MIFFSIGILFLIIGSLFRILPSKGNLPFYGYHSPLAAKTDAHWRLAQKTLIGYYLKTSGHTNYFLIEMLLLVFPIMPIFIMTEKKLQRYDLETGGNDNEYFND